MSVAFSIILEILCPIFWLSLIQQLDLIGKLSQIKLWLRLNAENIITVIIKLRLSLRN
jgi:hypothetical protein